MKTMSYEAFKVVHLFGVVIFLGNIIVTAVWKVYRSPARHLKINWAGPCRAVVHSKIV